MGITVLWDNPSLSIIRWQFDTSWTWCDVTKAEALTRLILGSVDHTVDIIWDLERTLALPTPLSHVLDANMEGFAGDGSVILLTGCNRFIHTVIRALTAKNRTLGYKLGFVDTLAEAREMLAVP